LNNFSESDAIDAKPYLQTGNCSISGQAFFRTRGGEAKTAAGLKVKLYPTTQFFVERSAFWREDFDPAMSPEAASYIKTATCDASGNFEFTNLPPGEYLVRCYITWLVDASRDQYSGGMAVNRVAVKENESKKIILTGD